MHQWDFSMKRANLHLIPLIQPRHQQQPQDDEASVDQAGSGATTELTGCVLIDSTRRGKRYPDALSKTVPIWCAVLNRASHRTFGTPSDPPPLQIPTDTVSLSEAAQIEARLDMWVHKFCASDLAVPCLEKPLCPVFVHAPHIPTLPTCAMQHHIVLVSVSPSETPKAFHTMHASYVQGAGDDHEAWAHGLTPALFWRHHRELLAPHLQREDRVKLVHKLVREERERSGQVPWLATDNSATRIDGTCLFIAARPLAHSFSHHERSRYAFIVHCSQSEREPSTTPATQQQPCESETPPVLRLGIDASKRGLGSFSRALPLVVDAVTDALIWETRNKEHPRGVLVCCSDGCQLSGAVAVAILAASYDQHRQFLGTGTDAHQKLTKHRKRISKDDTQRRLQWITGSVHSVSQTSPSRAHLQRVNAYLMGPLRQVRLWE